VTGIGWEVIEHTNWVLGRDSLTFSTIQLIAPIEAIDLSQQEHSPNRTVELESELL